MDILYSVPQWRSVIEETVVKKHTTYSETKWQAGGGDFFLTLMTEKWSGSRDFQGGSEKRYEVILEEMGFST